MNSTVPVVQKLTKLLISVGREVSGIDIPSTAPYSNPNSEPASPGKSQLMTNYASSCATISKQSTLLT